ncbi:MAG: hypothetical protein Roseis2KO_56150 [Roseivirga sp.]
MKFQSGFIYHIYNQSNRKDILFKDNTDYVTFLEKVRTWIIPNCELLSYCIMPNHYHFLALANDQSVSLKILGSLTSNELSNGFRNAQSQYAQYFNDKYNLSGSVFRPKPKAKCLNEGDQDYSWTCFSYIHQNPVKAGLCESPFDWKFSSAQEIKNGHNSPLVNLTALENYLGVNTKNIDEELSTYPIEHKLKRIF